MHPQYALVHALHCLLGFAGSLIAVASARGRVRDRPARRDVDVPRPQRPLLPSAAPVLPPRLAERRLPRPEPRRARAAADRRQPRLGPDRRLLRPPRSRRRHEWIARRLRAPYGPFRFLFWSLAALLPLLGLRMAGVDSGVVSLLQLIPTLILLIGVFSLVDIELSEVVPGRQRQRQRGRGRPRARRPTPGRPAGESRRLGRAQRRRAVHERGHALVPALASRAVRAGEDVRPRPRLGRPRRAALRHQPGFRGQLSRWTAPDRALRRRSPRREPGRRRSPSAAAWPTTPSPPGSPACARSR